MPRYLLRSLLGLMLLMSALPLVAQETNGRVISMWGTLNVRANPASTAPMVGELTGGTPLLVLGRTRTNIWYQIQTTDGLSGWVSAAYVDLNGSRSALPILDASAPPPAAPQAAAPAEAASGPAPTTNATGSANGTVTAGLLNLRAAPSSNAQIIAQLPNAMGITAIARSASNVWLRVQTPLGEGWVAEAYVRLDVGIGVLPVSEGAVVVNPAGAAPVQPIASAGPVTLGGNTQAIYQRGLQLGNRRGVFSKIGDSISVDPAMYAPFAGNGYDLGPYASLQPTVNTFRGSFGVTSVAATPGWTTTNLLNPQFANPASCQAGETPIACEYRLRRPTVALIMIGSNDVAFMPPVEYQGNLAAIVDFTVNQGVIPVLSTIPNRLGYEGSVTTYNQIIRNTATSFGVPLVDYNQALAGLPNQGVSGDGLHPSSPPDGPANSGRFNGEMLQFGYTMRNLVQLQALDLIRRRVY